MLGRGVRETPDAQGLEVTAIQPPRGAPAPSAGRAKAFSFDGRGVVAELDQTVSRGLDEARWPADVGEETLSVEASNLSQ